jgi:hypothetical protein
MLPRGPVSDQGAKSMHRLAIVALVLIAPSLVAAIVVPLLQLPTREHAGLGKFEYYVLWYRDLLEIEAARAASLELQGERSVVTPSHNRQMDQTAGQPTLQSLRREAYRAFQFALDNVQRLMEFCDNSKAKPQLGMDAYGTPPKTNQCPLIRQRKVTEPEQMSP